MPHPEPEVPICEAVTSWKAVLWARAVSLAEKCTCRIIDHAVPMGGNYAATLQLNDPSAMHVRQRTFSAGWGGVHVESSWRSRGCRLLEQQALQLTLRSLCIPVCRVTVSG